VDISLIIAHLSGAERRAALSFLGLLLQARQRAHEALLALASDFVAADVAAWRRAGTPSPSQLATRLDTLQEALSAALAELRLMARTLADRCPIPETWAYLKEYEHLGRGQREKLYQADTWKREVIQPIKTDHARVVAEMAELRRQLLGTAPRGEPGRRPKYPESVVNLVRRLLARGKAWKDVYQKCREKYPQLNWPKCASFTRTMLRRLKE
jgi:hypothetical protein